MAPSLVVFIIELELRAAHSYSPSPRVGAVDPLSAAQRASEQLPRGAGVVRASVRPLIRLRRRPRATSSRSRVRPRSRPALHSVGGVVECERERMPLPAVLLGGAERRTDERIEAVEQGVQWSPQSIRQISSYRLLVVRVRVRRSASGRGRGRPRLPLRMSLSHVVACSVRIKPKQNVPFIKPSSLPI